FFVNPVLLGGRERTEVFDDEGNKFASYQVDVLGVELDGGIQFGRFGELRTGVYRSRVHAKVDTGSMDLPTRAVPGGGVLLGAALNTLDRPAIPHHGLNLEAHGLFSRESFGADASYDKVQLQSVGFLGSGRHTVFAGAAFGTNLGSTIPIYDEFLLGGLFSLGGLSEGELRGQLYASAQVGYHYRIGSLPPVLGTGI